MAFTLTQLETLNRAIAQGTTRVRYTDGDHTDEVEYRSLSEMIQVRNLMQRELGLVKDAGLRRVAQRFRSGLG